MDDDDDEGSFGGAYENGHWIWDDTTEALLFVSDLPPVPQETTQKPAKLSTGSVEFRDDVDLIEQFRFRRRFQRKLMPGEADIITLQDIKDIAIFTAPMNFLSPTLINILHLPTTERFLRALILCSAYYLQVADKMAHRILEQQTKVRTPFCEILEREYRENLSDLRVLVAKEYCVMLIGGADTKKFHHMGPSKKRRSLSEKDARLFETLLRMSVQIVWLALGRKSFHQIELETNRLFKSEIFNSIEHTLKTGYISKMMPEEQDVLLGRCVRKDKKLNTRSPLMNEIVCDRDVDFRMVGLGVVKYPQMSPRLNYLWHAVAGNQEDLAKAKVTLGIIGMPRSIFDTMLRPLPQMTEVKASKSMVKSGDDVGSDAFTTSSLKKRKSVLAAPKRLYPEIVLPPKQLTDVYLPTRFPDEVERVMHVNDTQRKRWLNRQNKWAASGK